MEKKDWLAKNFEASRIHLTAVAYRILGSKGEAEDAIQEAWIRLNRSESEAIENLNAWLTTVVSRVCLDMLRSRKSRREEPLDAEISDEELQGPEADYLMADAIGPALLVVLDLLSPAERIAFVLHDVFDLSFEEIAPIIDRTEVTTRQLASRARKKVRGASPAKKALGLQQEAVSAFLQAIKENNFEALISLLHKDAVLRADETAVKVAESNRSRGAPQFKSEISGAKNIANTLKGKASEARFALVNGNPGLTWAPGGKPIVAFCFAVEGEKISTIEIVMDKNKLDNIQIEIIDKGVNE